MPPHRGFIWIQWIVRHHRLCNPGKPEHLWNIVDEFPLAKIFAQGLEGPGCGIQLQRAQYGNNTPRRFGERVQRDCAVQRLQCLLVASQLSQHGAPAAVREGVVGVQRGCAV